MSGRAITAATTVAAVIGHPVGHSLSPALHRAGFDSLGADWVYVAFDVAPGRAVAALEAMRTLGLGGLSVTMPHKTDVAAAVDRADPAAVALASVNTVSRDVDGALVGHSTDGDGLVAALAAHDTPVEGQRIGVVGAGGAGRSIIDALGRHGAAEIIVVNRDPDRAAAGAALAPGTARVGLVQDLAPADIIINATPVGMSGSNTGDGTHAATPVPTSVLRRTHTVVDIVYQPLETTFLQAAREVGARVIDGLGMLVHQAALQEQIWLGELPDVAAMRAAADRELTGRAR